MKSSFKLSALLGSLLVAFFLAFTPSRLASQPSGYCNVYPPDIPGNYSYVYYYCYGPLYYGYIVNVKIQDAATGAWVLDWTTGADNCFTFTGQEAKLKLGKSYRLYFSFYMPYSWYCQYITQYSYYLYCYGLAWLDWNMNARFNDPNEFLGVQTLQLSNWNSSTCTGTYGPFNITVPNTQQVGKTRLRVAHNMWGHYGSPGSTGCYLYYLWDYPPYYFYYYAYGEAEDYVIDFQPDIEATFPSDGDILRANETYDGSDANHPRPMVRMGSPQPSGAILRYRITGPKPSTNVVYEGLDPATGSIDINMSGYRQYDIQRARGTFATANAGFRANRGGEYRLSVTVGGTAPPAEANPTFTVAWDNDLSITDVVSPRTNQAPRFMKYLRGQTIRVIGTFQNTGLNNITEFYATARIVDPSGVEVYNRQVHFDAINDPRYSPLQPGQKIDMEFPTFQTNTIGVFKLYLECDLESAVDQEAYNNYLPRSDGDDYTFEIAYEFQVKANRVVKPALNEQLIGNRPYIPSGEFKNMGVSVASDFPARLIIYKLPDTLNSVYQSTVTIQDIQSGTYNTRVVDFDVFIPRETGQYMAKLICAHPEDPVRSDDTVRSYFSVLGGLLGTYRVGVGQDFPTIDSAMNALYMRGVSGNVVFELTDSYYQVRARTDVEPTAPAWDFRGWILNLGYNADLNTTYTVTWKPSTQKSLTKGSITIELIAPTGKGIAFGQTTKPSNTYSVYYEYRAKGSISRKYVNTPGYIVFDGGPQKSIKLRLVSYSRGGGQAVYMGPGSHHITIKNLIIENANSSLADKTWLPMTAYSPVYGFTYTPDTLLQGTTVLGYSAGVTIRSYLPYDQLEREQATIMGLDTIPASNNLVEGNEIYGFGYGVISIGYGQLWRETNYIKYYNNNNTFANNTIYNVKRAGIFLGYEQNSQIFGNKIYNVNGGTIDAYGILLGGQGSSSYKGYNNIGITINRNEISGVTSNVGAFGIKVEQEANLLPHPYLGNVLYPDVAESTQITNNVIWGVTVGTGNASRAGIHLLTARQANPDPLTSLLTPKLSGYYSRNDKIANNTIVISPNPGVVSTYPIAGIGIQSAKNTVVKNNAIALMDMNVDPNNQVYACIFYEGMMPSEMGLTSDRNAFWYANGSGGTVVRFVETDKNDNILDNGGNRNDFATLEQWQNWTGMDGNSVFGNFTNDFVYLGYEPNQRLRIATNPTPLGSILNNRGERIDWVTHDIDGNIRGAAGQRYDIGAVEFEGRLYLSDLEMIKITYPAKYQSSTGMFNDAQYVMDNTPTNVKALVRNSGNLQQSAVNVTVNIYREMADGSFNVVPEVTATKQVTLASGESVEVDFGLNDGQAPDFKPKTYGELANEGYYVPDQFLTMQANVTPRYKIVVSLSGDQQNANNTVSKVVRYYIPQSKTRALLSVENSMVQLDANSTADEIAGRLNYDSLVAAFRKLGWMIDITEGIFDFDIFDRKGWEPKAVDYRLFNSILWSDGDDKALTRQEKIDLRRFLTSGTVESKKNLVISSQEIVRANAADAEFLRGLLRAKNVAPGNPKGANVSNDGNDVIGLAVGRKLAMKIKRTGYSGDVEPYCGLMAVESTGEGQALAGGYYREHQGSTTDSIAGIATTTLTRNVVLFGVDWRHWGRIDMIIRGILDYVNANGGFIIPVELSEFDAKAVGNAVYVRWATESEYNTSKFEVERAEMRGAVKSEFEKVGEEKAAGTSTSRREYGPVVDRGVEFGKEYMYRLKVVDIDGATSYSREVMVKMEGEANWVGEVMPNPGVNEISFELSAVEGARVEAKLIDLAGRELKRVYTGVGNGNVVKVVAGVSELPSGVYTLVVKIGNETITRSVNIVK
ncbi:MAG: T9SS type A sorting domain-containing protein [Candidatus Kapaibacteriota bacterium]